MFFILFLIDLFLWRILENDSRNILGIKLDGEEVDTEDVGVSVVERDILHG